MNMKTLYNLCLFYLCRKMDKGGLTSLLYIYLFKNEQIYYRILPIIVTLSKQ